jgi:hypothetical protein
VDCKGPIGAQGDALDQHALTTVFFIRSAFLRQDLAAVPHGVVMIHARRPG